MQIFPTTKSRIRQGSSVPGNITVNTNLKHSGREGGWLPPLHPFFRRACRNECTPCLECRHVHWNPAMSVTVIVYNLEFSVVLEMKANFGSIPRGAYFWWLNVMTKGFIRKHSAYPKIYIIKFRRSNLSKKHEKVIFIGA